MLLLLLLSFGFNSNNFLFLISGDLPFCPLLALFFISFFSNEVNLAVDVIVFVVVVVVVVDDDDDDDDEFKANGGGSSSSSNCTFSANTNGLCGIFGCFIIFTVGDLCCVFKASNGFGFPPFFL